MKNIIIAIVVLVVLVGGFFIIKNMSNDAEVINDGNNITTPTPVATTTSNTGPTEVIGKSVENRDITAYHYGATSTDAKEILFIGGIHGGYEWNTVLVAYQLSDYLEKNPNVIPTGVRVTVIPVLNPDGLYKTVGKAGRFTTADVPSLANDTVPGRFNAHTVDLNRNFDCDWQTSATWQNKTVSGGSAAFSEPESSAIKTYVEAHKPTAAIVWYSSAGGVFASNCHSSVLPETNTLTKTYSDASGYPAHQDFNFYEITGDMVNWFAKSNIPAISVLLTNHTDTEWTKNQKGIDAVLKHYAN